MKLKGLERAVKRGAFAIASAFSGDAPGPRPDWRSRSHRVLFLRYDRIGDMLIATPILRAIATAHPTIQLDVLASPSNHTVLQGNPHVRRVHVFDKRRPSTFARTARALHGCRYDAVISGMLKPSATTAALMMSSRAPYRIGIARETDAHTFNVPVRPAPPGRAFARQLGEILRVFDVDPDTAYWHYDLFLTGGEQARAETLWREYPGTPRILVNVSAFTGDRRWPVDRYAAVIRHVQQRLPHARILVTGDPRNWSDAGAAAAAASVVGVDVSPIRDAFAFVAAADMLITPDTSLAHAAAAEGIPAIILFRSGAEMFAPPGDNHACIFSRGSLQDLPVDDVIPAVDRMLARW